MKKLILPFLFICACSNIQNGETDKHISKKSIKTEPPEIIEVANNEITFKEINSKAVLLGNKIELLDEDLKTIEDISNMTETIIDVVGVSDSLFNSSKDFCSSFWYVRIKSLNKNGIVNGRYVYKIQDSKQDTSFTNKSNRIEIYTTEFYGMGVVYKEDLIGCSVDQPIVLKDSENNYFGLVYLVSNEYSKKASWDNEFPFFEIRDDDGAYDKIASIETEGTKIKLKIHRRFQEGENDYEVSLQYNQGKYIAEYLNFGEVKYK